MSTRCRRRKCCNCHQLYDPDPRSRYHQSYCSQPQCRKASKVASQLRWRESAKGRNYFRGKANRKRVTDWREAHPGYSRNRPAHSRPAPNPAVSPNPSAVSPNPSNGPQFPCALQDQLTPQTLAPPADKPALMTPSPAPASALQDMIFTQSLLVTGLIATLIGSGDGALQDDIASTIDRLIRLGQQVQGPAASFSTGLGGIPNGGLQTSALQGAIAAGSPAVQLDRPSPGP